MKIDKQTLSDFKQNGVGSIRLYFYDAGCEGTKLDIEEDPDLENNPLTPLSGGIDGLEIYCEEKDKDKFQDCTITRTLSTDHTGKQKVRYIYKSEKVKDRCGCGSSFSFGEKKVKIDLEKFREFKKNFEK